jgi:hypothetical protein
MDDKVSEAVERLRRVTYTRDMLWHSDLNVDLQTVLAALAESQEKLAIMTAHYYANWEACCRMEQERDRLLAEREQAVNEAIKVIESIDTPSPTRPARDGE